MLNKLLQDKNFLKIVCGAGNEDCEFVKRLVFVYAKAGCKVFDISARKDVLDSAKEGVNLAGADDVHFCVSVGIKGDPHISKAFINKSKCVSCNRCVDICSNSAITNNQEVIESKCIGCGLCSKECPQKTIDMYNKDVELSQVLPELLENGVEIIELHITGQDKNELNKKWEIINSLKPAIVSICIDRENFGNKEVLSRINEMIKNRKDFSTIIQADGIPMSGSDDTYKTTLQAVAMAEIIQNAKLPVYIVVSGGTNSKTAELCKQCGIDYSGIAIGSWARNIVKPYILKEDFWQNKTAQNKAIEVASELCKAI